jgi:hypothetical protein
METTPTQNPALRPDARMIADTTTLLAISLAGLFDDDAKSAQEVAEKFNTGSDGRDIDHAEAKRYLRLARITSTIAESLGGLAMTGFITDLRLITVAIEVGIKKALKAEEIV